MGIGADTPLRLTIKGRKLTVEPMTEEQREKKFEESLSETNRTYAKDLKALAE